MVDSQGILPVIVIVVLLFGMSCRCYSRFLQIAVEPSSGAW